MAKGEFELIGSIRELFSAPEGVLGIGDDCAVIPQKEGMETLVSTDMLMEGVHFLLSDVDPYSLGWKSAAVNISDIAAMGGRPVASFLAFAVPPTLGDAFLKLFMDGYRELSMKFGCPLLGGDTTSSNDRFCISVTVMGECRRGASRKRSMAVPGDGVFVTGPLGDSGAGLKIILEDQKRTPLEDTLVARHYRPLPRVEAGLALAECSGVHAMMDISDGVGSDIHHIMEESKVGAVIDVRTLPKSAELVEACAKYGWDAAHLCLDGGEDYELLFSAAPECFRDGRINGVECYRIGTIVEGNSVRWTGSDDNFTGFHHF